MLSQTCSSCAACQLTSGQITVQSSSLRLSETGSKRSEQRPRISSLGHPRKTATAKASMGGCETNCSTAKSFTRCAKHKSSSKAGGNTTTPSDHTVHWATAHQRPKPSSRWTKGRSCTHFQYGPLKWGCSPWGLKALNADVQLELVTLWPELGQGAAQHVYGDTPRPFARFKELPPKQQQVQLFHLP